MKDVAYVLGVIAAMGAVTWGLRALPFLAGRWLVRHPLVRELGRFLPLAVMALLVMHSARDAAASHSGGPWPEAVALVLVMAAQWRWRHPLPSMLIGTVVYVAWRQMLA